MKKVLVLVMAGILFFSPFAMAGDLGSSDSDFLFSSDQVTAITIPSQEMQDTQGQLLDNMTLIVLPLFSPIVGSADGATFNNCINLLAGCSLVQVVGGLVK